MSARTHLSIGEVLALLTDDFPDLTITKIRFLESQGLIDPERTASGYRKFYEPDIDRLRWILRQQRENFLPLKVIKDRLDRSEGKVPVANGADPDTEPAQAELDLSRGRSEDDPPPVWMADHAAAREVTPAAVTVAAGPPAEVTPAPPKLPPKAPAARNGAPAASANPAVPSTTPPEAVPTAGTHDDGANMSDPRPSKPAANDPEEVHAPVDPVTPRHVSPGKPAMNPHADVSDVSMTRSELLDATGLDDRTLGNLEAFGIVLGVDDPSGAIYGADALVCARQAATFLELGLEPRHLRAFKIAAEREAGLYEQLLLPLLRKRDPSARSEASELVARLTRSGATLHGALLQRSLRSQLRPKR